MDPENEGGSAKLLDHFSGNDADDSFLPTLASNDYRRVLIEAVGEDSFGGFDDHLVLQVAAFLVLFIEEFSENLGFLRVFGNEELKSDIGIINAANRVDAGTELESDVASCEFSAGVIEVTDPQEGLDALFEATFEGGETVPGDDPVVIAQRHDIGNGAHYGEIKKVPGVDLALDAEVFAKASAKEECDSGPGHFRSFAVVIAPFGVDDGFGRGQYFGRFVVVGDDNTHPEFISGFDLFVSSCSAVACEDDVGSFGMGAADGVDVDAVAFGLSVGDVADDVESGFAKESEQNGGTGHAIDIVITVDVDALVLFPGIHENAACGFKIGKVERGTEAFEFWVEEALGSFEIEDSALGEDSGDDGRDEEFLLEHLRDVLIMGLDTPDFFGREGGRNHACAQDGSEIGLIARVIHG